MLKTYFKIAWRNVTRNKVYSFINILGLVLGICSCLVIYLIVHFELSFDNFHRGKEDIYRVVSDTRTSQGQEHAGGIPDPAPIAIRNELAGLEDLAIFHNYYASVAIKQDGLPGRRFAMPNERETVSDIVIAEPAYFTIFRYKWLAGDPGTALKEPFKVVLTESKAYTYFGKRPLQEILHKTIVYNDSLTLSVSGIVKDFPVNTDFNFRDFISFATVNSSFLKNEFNFGDWNSGNKATQVFVRLPEGTTAARINARLTELVKRHLPAGENQVGSQRTQYRLQQLSDLHFNGDYEDAYSRKAHLPTLYGLMGIALFILVIAVVNFINLSTAQSVKRAKEIAIRKVCGSKRISLILQLLGETFFLTGAAAFLSLLCTPLVLAAFRSYIPQGVTLNVFNPSTWICLFLLILFTTLLAGLYPARLASSYVPIQHLRGTTLSAGNRHAWLREGLVVFQFTISLAFIIGSIVMGNQIRFILHKDLGFTKDAIITIETNPQYPFAKKELLAGRIRQLSGVALVSVSDGTPMARDHWANPLSYAGDPATPATSADCQLEWGDANFVPLYQLKLLAGRNLQSSDTMQEFLINETCARALGFKRPGDAIGRRLRTLSPEGEHFCPVVGVLADFHASSLHEPIHPAFIASSARFSWNINVKLSTSGRQIGQFRDLEAEIEKIWKEIYPDDKFGYSFFDQSIAKRYERDLQTSQLMNWAMGIAIFISCMGLFGLSAFTAQQRTREIGIRKVLGASVAGIANMLCRDFVGLIIIALFIASPIAWYFMNRWLQDWAYRNEISGWVFVLAGSGAILIGLLTVGFHAVKAALANPVGALRSE